MPLTAVLSTTELAGALRASQKQCRLHAVFATTATVLMSMRGQEGLSEVGRRFVDAGKRCLA